MPEPRSWLSLRLSFSLLHMKGDLRFIGISDIHWGPDWWLLVWQICSHDVEFFPLKLNYLNINFAKYLDTLYV